jgi:multiple sugar transport system substrate-binding protein
MSKQTQPDQRTLSRRQFLRGATLGVAGLALAACGAPQQQAQPTAAAGEQAGAAAPAQSSGGVQTFRAMMWQNSPVLDENFKQRAAMFNEAHKGTYEIDLQLLPYDQYWAKIDLAYGAKEPVDVYMWDVPAYTHYKNGLLRNLQPDIDKVPAFADSSQYPLDLYKYWRFDGTNLYGVPENLQMMAVYYNKDLFDKAGVAYPDATWTYDKLLEAAKALTVTEGDKTVQWGFDKGALGQWWGAQTFGWAAGSSFFDKVIEPTKFTVSDPRNVAGLQWLNDMVYTHKVGPDATQAAAIAQDISLFQTGKVAMVTDGTWYMSSNANSPFKWDMAPLPKWQDARALPFWFGGWVVAKDSKAPEGAVAWAVWSATDYQKELVKNRDWIPVRKAERDDPAFLSGLPAGFKSVMDSLPDARIGDLYHAKSAQLANEIMGPTFTEIWNNNMTPEAGAKEIDDKANALIAQG